MIRASFAQLLFSGAQLFKPDQDPYSIGGIYFAATSSPFFSWSQSAFVKNLLLWVKRK
jgi:hypothetical protein